MPSEDGGIKQEELAEALEVSRVQAAVKVGDTIADIQEGVHAGVWTVGVLEGSSLVGLTQAELAQMSQTQRQDAMDRAEKQYRAHGAHEVIRNLSELPQFIAQIEHDM